MALANIDENMFQSWKNYEYLDPEGDLIIDLNNERAVVVSSKVLSVVSPVLKSMIECASKYDTPQSVPARRMQMHNTEPVEFLLLLLHSSLDESRSRWATHMMNLGFFTALVDLAEEYKCLLAVRHACTAALHRILNLAVSPSPDKLSDAAQLAHRLKLSGEFRNVTGRMIEAHLFTESNPTKSGALHGLW